MLSKTFCAAMMLSSTFDSDVSVIEEQNWVSVENGISISFWRSDLRKLLPVVVLDSASSWSFSSGPLILPLSLDCTSLSSDVFSFISSEVCVVDEVVCFSVSGTTLTRRPGVDKGGSSFIGLDWDLLLSILIMSLIFKERFGDCIPSIVFFNLIELDCIGGVGCFLVLVFAICRDRV